MKKITHIVLPVLIGAVALFLVGLLIAGGREPAENRKGVAIYDVAGEMLITAKSEKDIQKSEYWAYLQIVLTEATEMIAQEKGCSAEEAEKDLFSEGYQIHTAFDKVAFTALKAVDFRWKDVCDTACAITDLKGNLLAVYTTDVQETKTNHALEKRSPYSSFKALSVYTPAVEAGKVAWTSLYHDSPYKQMTTEDGTLTDWPANATGSYSQKDITVYDALRKSLNTVAVKCLADVGTKESITFLQNSFGIPLKEEEYVLQNYGEEEVIGSVALGYLETGITPVDMAGYYQIFANGGKYAAPRAVKGITREGSTGRYIRNTEQKQVISPATADLMNKLLTGVVAPGGTGESAACRDVAIAGKTGTGDNYADNWFVGVTPGYSLAVWHGQHDKNQASEMFAAVIQDLYRALPNANRKFITHKNLYQIAYCVQSGKAFSSHCTTIETGYFASKDALPMCDVCGKE